MAVVLVQSVSAPVAVLLLGSLVVGLAIVSSMSPHEAVVLTALAGAMLLLERNPAGQSATVAIAIAVAVAVAVAPFFIWRLRDTRVAPVPHAFGLITAVYLVIGGLLSRPEDTNFIPFRAADWRAEGALLTAGFLVIVWAGTGLAMQLLRRPAQLGTSAPSGVHRFVMLIVAGYAASLLLTVSGLRGSLGAIPTVIDLVRIVGMLGIFGAYLTGFVGKRWLLLVAGVLWLEVLLGIGSAAIYAAAEAPLAALVLYVTIRRRVPWTALLAGVLVGLVLNTVKLDYRDMVSRRDRADATTEGLGYLSYFMHEAAGTSFGDISKSAGRFAYSVFDLNGYVLAEVPSDIGHWGLTTYRNIPFAMVPRVLVPGKPELGFGNEFGRHYGIISQSDSRTAANLPLVTESYVSFGIYGVLVAGLALGFVFAMVCSWFSDGSFASAVTVTVLAAALLHGVESDSTLVLTALPLLMIGIPPLSRWASQGASLSDSSRSPPKLAA